MLSGLHEFQQKGSLLLWPSGMRMQDVSKSGKERGDEQPSWSQNFLSEGHGEGQFGGSQPQLQGQTQQESDLAPSLDFAEPELQMFDYISQVRATALTPLIQPVLP